MIRHQTNSTLKRLAIAWCVIVGAATIQAIWFFALPFDVVGSTVDMRFMLIFAALGILGVILLTLAAYGRISAAWAIVPFIPPGALALHWGQIIFADGNFNLVAIAMLGLPIVAYTGGVVVSIYSVVIQSKLSRAVEDK